MAKKKTEGPGLAEAITDTIPKLLNIKPGEQEHSMIIEEESKQTTQRQSRKSRQEGQSVHSGSHKAMPREKTIRFKLEDEEVRESL